MPLLCNMVFRPCACLQAMLARFGRASVDQLSVKDAMWFRVMDGGNGGGMDAAGECLSAGGLVLSSAAQCIAYC